MASTVATFLGTGVGAALFVAVAQAQQAPTVPPASVPLQLRDAAVTIDFSKSRGPFLHPERYNNIGRWGNNTALRDSDVEFLNEQGLHGKVYRTWVITETVYDPKTGKYNYEGLDDYLADVSKLSDELLLVLDTRESMGKIGRQPEEIKPIITTILKHLKINFPKIKYIEAFNEPDHNTRELVKPDQLYDYYKVYYQAVNEINSELKPATPLLLGGPVTGTCGSPWAPAGPNNLQWIPKFLDGYAADPDPAKRLDFLSYHVYGYFKDQVNCKDYVPIRTDPSQLAGKRDEIDGWLRQRGIDVNIPSFITETGPYPGPSYDDKANPHADYIRQASGMASYMYWHMENPKNVPFNWVIRHGSDERKDQLITRSGPDKKTPLTRTFSPYGNSMAMMAKLKDERVAAQSNTLQAGKGIYALATKDDSGAAVMLWNYQQAGTQPYRVTIDMGGLPANLRGKRLRQRMYRIDDQVSNYWGNPSNPNLQQVSDTTLKPRTQHKVTIELPANGFQLVVLEPATPTRTN